MFDEYFNEYLKHYPSIASFLGDRSSDDRIEVTISPQFEKRWKKVIAKYTNKVKSTGKVDNSVDGQLLRYSLKSETESFKYPLELMPISSFSNPVLEFTFMERTVYPENVSNSKKRHECYILYLKQCIKNMKKGIVRGYTIPKHICQKVIDDIASFIALKDYVTDKRLTRFFETSYRPVLESLLRFLKQKYLPLCRESIGISDVTNGKNIYKYLLKVHTTLDISPAEIHALGLKEVKRIKSEFQKLIPKNLKHLGVMAYIERVQQDPKNYMHDPEETLEAYRAKQAELRKTVVEKYFYDQVKPYEIRRVPKMLEASSAGAFYYPGANKRPGRFFLNLRDTKENPRFTIETLSIHEGEPGHHYQFQYMEEKGLPPRRIFGIEGNAFAEGWALYAESLSLSKDTFTMFGRLTYEMFRAVRCVVDTGIHYYGWSYDEALAFMKQHIAMKESELVSELNRYICIPGQATAYKVGEQFFLEQRKNYLKKNPNKTIKDYHRVVLDQGVLPLKVLARIIQTS